MRRITMLTHSVDVPAIELMAHSAALRIRFLDFHLPSAKRGMSWGGPDGNYLVKIELQLDLQDSY